MPMADPAREEKSIEPLIALEQVGAAYSNGKGLLQVFTSVSFTVGKGEFLAVVGPSGCGKTTLLRVIGGLLKPTSGKVAVQDNDEGESTRRRTFSYVFQNPVLLPWRTVRKNVALPSEVFGDGVIRARVEAMIELVGLREFSDSFPDQLSGGMQSRVAIARALTYDPKVLLMDEPFGSLDEITRTRLNLELLRIWRTIGAGVVFVTHSLSEAVFLADRVLIMGQMPTGVIADIPNNDLARPRALDMFEQVEFTQRVHEIRSYTREWEA